MPFLAPKVTLFGEKSGPFCGVWGAEESRIVATKGLVYVLWFPTPSLCQEGLLARIAWAEGRFKALDCENVIAPVVNMARLLSLMVHLASAAG